MNKLEHMQYQLSKRAPGSIGYVSDSEVRLLLDYIEAAEKFIGLPYSLEMPPELESARRALGFE